MNKAEKTYSRVVKYDGKCFRYNYKEHCVEYVVKLSKKELAECLEGNKEWLETHSKPLFKIDDKGYMFMDSRGLSQEHWESEDREYYLDIYAEDIRCILG